MEHLKNTHSSNVKMCQEYILSYSTINFCILHSQIIYCFAISTSLKWVTFINISHLKWQVNIIDGDNKLRFNLFWYFLLSKVYTVINNVVWQLNALDYLLINTYYIPYLYCAFIIINHLSLYCIHTKATYSINTMLNICNFQRLKYLIDEKWAKRKIKGEILDSFSEKTFKNWFDIKFEKKLCQ